VRVEPVLAAVRLVGDEHDVVPLGEQGVFVIAPLGAEFLDRGEDHAARRHLQQIPQMLAALRLFRLLAQQLLPGGEGVEELIVQVVAIGEDDQRWVFHRRVLDDLSGVEQHGQALAAALGVPHHAHALVAVRSRRAHRALDGLVDGVVLVIGGDLLDHLPGAGLEHGEIVHQVKEAARLEYTFDQHLELWLLRRGQDVALDGAPGLEPFPARREGAHPRAAAVADRQDFVGSEQVTNVVLVGQELVIGAANGGAFVGGILQLDDRQRQAVDEQHDIRAAHGARLGAQIHAGDRELVDGQPVVVVRIVEVHQPDLVVLELAVSAVGHVDALGQQAVEGVVVDQRICTLDAGELPQRLVESVGGQGRVDALQRRAQPAGQQHLVVAGPLGGRLARCDIRAEADVVAQVAQPVERGLFDGVFVEMK